MSIEFKKLKEEETEEKTSWVELGTELFAFTNVVLLSICIVTCLGLIGCTTMSQIFTDDPNQASLWYLCLACGVSTSVIFIFAVLLCVGVYQKKPSFLLAYVIFGMVILILIVSTVVSFEYLDIDEVYRYYYKGKDYDCKWILIGITVFYTFVLGMILDSYVKMRYNQKQQRITEIIIPSSIQHKV